MIVVSRLTRAFVFTTATLFLGACSASAGQAGSTASTAKASAPSPSSTAPGSQGAQGDAGSVSSASPVLGSHRTASGSFPLQVDLNEVTVDGQVMTVTWSAKNLGPAGEKWQVTSFFGDGVYQNGPDGKTASSETSSPADGVFVIDVKNAKRYLPARDAGGNCVCSQNGSNTFIDGGQTTMFQAVFKAPPADVTTVSVSVPHSGVFSKVTLER